jgi:hypothetical protein
VDRLERHDRSSFVQYPVYRAVPPLGARAVGLYDPLKARIFVAPVRFSHQHRVVGLFQERYVVFSVAETYGDDNPVEPLIVPLEYLKGLALVVAPEDVVDLPLVAVSPAPEPLKPSSSAAASI